MKLVSIWVCALAALLFGCSLQRTGPTRSNETVNTPKSTNATQASTLLGEDDFCVDGLKLGTTVDELKDRHTFYDRSLGGFDYTYPWTDVHVSSDGKTVDVIKSYVNSLCANQRRLRLSGATDVTREQVQAVYGDPSKKVADGDEFWFYTDDAKANTLIFRFRDDQSMTAKEVYVARLPTAVRLWYPLLGDLNRPRPLTMEDAALGPIRVGMAHDQVERTLGEDASEGELRPYGKLLFRDEQVQVFHDIAVRGIFVKRDSSLTTPRGIHVGSSSNEVLTAYGPARVVPDGNGGQYWSYENLRYGVGLVFLVKDGRVTQTAVASIDFEYRPSVQN